MPSLEQYKKVDVGYYILLARTTLNVGVLVFHPFSSIPETSHIPTSNI
jgi:hypothetical protein